MTYGLYAVLDHKTGFLPITCDQNDPAAARNFAHAIMQAGSLLNTHAEDFELYKLGDYDSETGTIILLPVKELVAEGYTYKEVKK